jgi:hypothetical protein
VLTAPRSESIRKAEEILLVDGLQNVHDGLLNDFVLQTQHSHIELHFDPVSLWVRLR